MRFMVIMYPGPEAEAGRMPTEAEFAAMGAFNEALVKAGVLLAGEGLHPSAQGARVRWADGQPQVSDGPFTEAEEVIGGFWIWQVRDRDEAIAWVRRCPAQNGQMIELRRVYEAEDFGDALTPELREAEDRLRAQSTELAAGRQPQ